MARPLLLVVALLAAAPSLGAQRAPAIPARRTFHHDAHIRMERHAPSGWTIVELSPLRLGGALPAELRTAFRFPGTEPPNAPGTLTFALVARAGREATDPFGTEKALPVSLALDGGAPVQVAATHFRNDLTADTVESTVYATMPRATFLRLAAAGRAEVRAAGHAWTLAPDMLEALRDLASRLSPAGYRAARAEQGTVAALAADTTGAPVLQARDVDVPVRPRGLLARPAFPAGETRAPRRIVFRYVVDTLGAVEPGTLRGETPKADAPFLESLRAAAAKWRFTPARKDGRAVRMEVRQVYVFDPSGDT